MWCKFLISFFASLENTKTYPLIIILKENNRDNDSGSKNTANSKSNRK